MKMSFSQNAIDLKKTTENYQAFEFIWSITECIVVCRLLKVHYATFW